MPKKKAPSAAENQKGLEKRYAKLVARVWADKEFRERLISDPETVLKEAGFKIGEGRPVKVLELDVEKNFYLILPDKPSKSFTDIAVESALLKAHFSMMYTNELC
jgi:hypothetical protein